VKGFHTFRPEARFGNCFLGLTDPCRRAHSISVIAARQLDKLALDKLTVLLILLLILAVRGHEV